MPPIETEPAKIEAELPKRKPPEEAMMRCPEFSSHPDDLHLMSEADQVKQMVSKHDNDAEDYAACALRHDALIDWVRQDNGGIDCESGCPPLP